MGKKLNVLFIASWYPSKYLPTNGDFIERHAKAVSGFCNVAVIHIYPGDGNKKFDIQEVKNENLHEISVFHRKIMSKISIISKIQNYQIKNRAFKIAFRKACEAIGEIDIVHLNVFLPGGFFALYLKRKFKIPFIVTEHWTKFLETNPGRFSKAEQFAIKKTAKEASVVCPVSHDLRNAMVNAGIKAHYVVVPNVVDTRFFNFDDAKVAHDRLRFLHVSHMKNEHKNITGIISAVKKVSEQYSNFTVTFVGSNDIDSYKKLSEKLEIPDGILNFQGKVSYETVSEMMKSHDVLLMFSNYENLPCVISEAHVCGLPVISSDVGGIPEMIHSKNGILVEANDKVALENAILKMIEKYQDFDLRSISREAEDYYSYESVGAEFQNIYLNVLNSEL